MRLLDLGLEAFLLTATIEAIIAQRLCRTVCANCKEPYTPTEEQLMELQLRPEDVADRQFFRGRGCDVCHGSGYKGRTALFEIMVMDDGLRDYDRSLRRKLILGVYVIPVIIVSVIIYLTNFH